MLGKCRWGKLRECYNPGEQGGWWRELLWIGMRKCCSCTVWTRRNLFLSRIDLPRQFLMCSWHGSLMSDTVNRRAAWWDERRQEREQVRSPRTAWKSTTERVELAYSRSLLARFTQHKLFSSSFSRSDSPSIQDPVLEQPLPRIRTQPAIFRVRDTGNKTIRVLEGN